MVEDYQHHMLLVPREETSKDGGECDKVGVSFYTFRTEGGSKCSSTKAGDCLHNQLFHKHNYDLQKLAINPNAETTYLIHGMRKFKGSMDFRTGMEKVLKYSITSIQSSLITLSLDADNLRVVTVESLGIIVEAYVETFTSHSKEGNMIVTIKNIGDYKAEYRTSVTDCTMNILEAVPEQARTLESLEETELLFRIFTLYNMETSNECLVTLKGPHAKVYDSVIVRFDTKKHKSKYSWEWQEENKASKAKKENSFGLGSCDCAFFDIACKFIKFCWLDLLILAIIILCIIAIVIGIIIFFLAGGGQFLPTFLCYFCRTFGCCLQCVACFTKFFVKESVKAGVVVVKSGGKRRKHKHKKRRKHKHKHHQHKHRSHKKKKEKKKKT
jgi:hypothetical protein